MTKVLAENCILDKLSDHAAYLQIAPKHASLANEKQKQQLAQALEKKFGAIFKVNIKICATAANTPAQQTENKTSEQLVNAKNNLIADPHVQSILEDFGGSLDEKSIKLVKP